MPDLDPQPDGPPTAVVYFAADGFRLDGPKLMGRQSAGFGFLTALVRHGRSGRLHVQARTAALAEQAMALAMAGQPAGAAVPTLVHHLPEQLESLADPGTLYFPGPEIHRFAHQRETVGARRHSLCGVTHTISSHGALDSLAALLTAPVRSWDAVVCTSSAVRDAVRRLLEQQMDYLRWRLGAQRFVLPQLPLIPLGVHCDDFTFTAAERAAARADLGLAPEDTVVLFLGRLSFHAKAHPLPMYVGLQRVARRLPPGQRVVLLQCGWFASDGIAAAFRGDLASLAPDVVGRFLDGRDPALRRRAWAAADIFCSLADNLQESFGLTPVEAMAAGLPAVVTDWDGYRDTVRDGLDGVRVPTTMPAAPLGLDLARLYDTDGATYDTYSGLTSQFVAVDVEATEAAFDRLLRDPELRRRLGAAGRARARDMFDWGPILRRYETLWAELAERRRADPDPLDRATDDGERRGWQRPAPARGDPFALFAAWPTQLLAEDTLVLPATGMTGAAAAVETMAARRRMSSVAFAEPALPPTEDCAMVLAELDRHREGTTVGTLLALVPPARRGLLARGLVWMAKLDLVRLAPVRTAPTAPPG